MNRWAEFAHNKANEIVATFTSGAMVANGVDDRWTLSDWSTLLGMVYVTSMLIPRIYEFIKWIINKCKSRKQSKLTENNDEKSQ